MLLFIGSKETDFYKVHDWYYNITHVLLFLKLAYLWFAKISDSTADTAVSFFKKGNDPTPDVSVECGVD